MIDLGSFTGAVARLGIRAELTLQTETKLQWIRHALAGPGDGLDREALVEREAALALLLDDLEHCLPSPGVLAAAVQLRA